MTAPGSFLRLASLRTPCVAATAALHRQILLPDRDGERSVQSDNHRCSRQYHDVAIRGLDGYRGAGRPAHDGSDDGAFRASTDDPAGYVARVGELIGERMTALEPAA